MRSKLIRFTILMAVVPTTSVLLLLYHPDAAGLRLLILFFSVACQLLVVLYSKSRLNWFVRPSVTVLEEMNVQRIPWPYEPGKFRVEIAVAGVCLWTGIAAPLLCWLAQTFSVTVAPNPVLRTVGYTVPNQTLLLLTLLCLVLGSLSFPMWVQFSRVQVILDEPGEKKRYLLRGFADEVECPEYARSYLKKLNEQ